MEYPCVTNVQSDHSFNSFTFTGRRWSVILFVQFGYWIPTPELFQVLAAQDTGNRVMHPVSRRLGKLSGKNNSRDWWRVLGDGPDSWMTDILTDGLQGILFLCATSCMLGPTL